MQRLQSSNQIIDKKLQRLAEGNVPRVLDLFAGCGGISLGFQTAGCQIDAAVEFDPHTARTHAINFNDTSDPEQFEKHAKARDITIEEPESLCKDLGLGPAEAAFDIVVGGPPCQAYARVGRAKLREVAEHPSAFKVDPRGNLYLRHLEWIRRTKPLAILIENVPDVLNYGGHNVMGEIAEVLDDMGYDARYSLINSAFNGVPQMRDRVFLVGLIKDLGVSPSFPQPNRKMTLPSGYAGSRSVALKLIDLFGNSRFEEASPGMHSLPGPVTCEDALGDLPPITLHLEGKLKRGARRFDTLKPYDEKRPLSAYGRLMRSWPGFENNEGVYDHVIRSLPRDTDIFREMRNGAEYPEAHATAERLWRKEIGRIERFRGQELTDDEKSVLHRRMVPPYPVSSFPNRWWKLRSDFPSRTLMAHIGKDTYSHIHYDSAQARVISVREAARLQSFPDGFTFSGTMNPAFRQIGNAVPPIMAKRLAETMLKSIQGSVTAAVAAE